MDELIAERKSLIKSEEAALKAMPSGDLYLDLQEQKKRAGRAKLQPAAEIGNTVDSALQKSRAKGPAMA